MITGRQGVSAPQAEVYLRRMAAHLRDDAIFLVDAEGRILTWSPAAASITGISLEEALGTSFSALYLPGDVDAGKPARDLAEVSSAGQLRDEGWRARWPDSRFWADVFICRLPGGSAHAPFGVILRDATERRRTEQTAHAWCDRTSDAILTLDNAGTIRSCNRAAAAMFNWPLAEISGRNVEALVPQATRAHRDRIHVGDAHTDGRLGVSDGQETTGRQRDGTTFPIHLSIDRIDADGEPAFTAVIRDLTAQKMLESRLHASQKMEALGHLAGGVAHNFNNLLMIVGGYCETLRNQTDWTGAQHMALEQIAVAAEQAASLTSQLLAFSRRSIIEPSAIDFHAALVQAGQLLQRTMGEDITLDMHLGPRVVHARMNQGDVGQILINLAINARDAMPLGGVFSVRTDLVTLDVPAAAQRGLLAGDYVRLDVGDTGTGMTPDTAARVFEPFFTTKPFGRGTGLGLATVRGIVKDSGGAIEIETTPGQGTLFTILLPTLPEDVATARTGPAEPSRPPVGTETILVVEDDAAVRDIVATMLRDLGYSTLEASSVPEAVSATQDGARIDLLVSDVMMPEVGGPELAERLQRYAPAMRVLFMSGYADDEVLSRRVEAAEVAFLKKPFTRLTLARTVRTLLDAGRPDALACLK